MKAIRALIEAAERAVQGGYDEQARSLAREAAQKIKDEHPEVYEMMCRSGAVLLRLGGF